MKGINIMKRTNTRKVMVGNVQIGEQNKVAIQSMCNTKTKDVDATVKQILELEKAGCEIKTVLYMRERMEQENGS